MKPPFNIDNIPYVKRIRDRDNFTAVSTIPLRYWHQLDVASSWAESRWEEANRRYRRLVDVEGRSATFEFETDEDTAEFLFKFG